MSEHPAWIDDEQARELLSLEDAIGILLTAYRRQRDGAATSMRRAHLRTEEAILHAVGGVITPENVAGTKTWTYTPGGAAPLVTLFSLDDGRVLGVVEAFGLGQIRTAATSGLGTAVLARSDARVLALLGTGRQAYEQARAVTCVRSIEEIRVFGRDPGRRNDLVGRLAQDLDVTVHGFDDAARAVDGADVVTTITRAGKPFVRGDMLRPGTHINAVGAIVPSRRELDETAVGRCSFIVADSVEQAREDSGELRAAESVGMLAWENVRGLSDIVDSAPGELRGDDDITLFKSLGIGLADVALGMEILRRAETTTGLGARSLARVVPE